MPRSHFSSWIDRWTKWPSISSYSRSLSRPVWSWLDRRTSVVNEGKWPYRMDCNGDPMKTDPFWQKYRADNQKLRKKRLTWDADAGPGYRLDRDGGVVLESARALRYIVVEGRAHRVLVEEFARLVVLAVVSQSQRCISTNENHIRLAICVSPRSYR